MKKHLLSISAVAIVGLAACGGLETGEPTPTSPSESQCVGAPSGGCDDIDPEYCIQLGCELHREQDSYPMCTGEKPAACESMITREQCGRNRGCSWSE